MYYEPYAKDFKFHYKTTRFNVKNPPKKLVSIKNHE